MDDGSKVGPGFHLNTLSYTGLRPAAQLIIRSALSEVELLVKVLKENFDLNCSINKGGKDQYRIYIRTNSMEKFRSLVTPHFHESMLYKLTVSTD